MVPKYPSNGMYIVAVEHVCSKLNQGEADELRVEVKNVLKKVQLPRTNIKKEEGKTMKLREDNTRMILTADKGVVLVVMDKEDYINKAEDLLTNPPTNWFLLTPHQTEKQAHQPP